MHGQGQARMHEIFTKNSLFLPSHEPLFIVVKMRYSWNLPEYFISFYCVHTSGLNLGHWISSSESYFFSHPSDQYL